MGRLKNGLSMRFLMCHNANYSVIANWVSEDCISKIKDCISQDEDCISQDEDCKSEIKIAKKIAKSKAGLQTCCHEKKLRAFTRSFRQFKSFITLTVEAI